MKSLQIYQTIDNYYDISFNSKGQFSIIEGVEQIAQQIKTNLYLIYGEWFLNVDEGVDYFGVVFEEGSTRNQIDDQIINAILSTNGVLYLNSYTSNYDRTSGTLGITFNAQTTQGETGNVTTNVSV